MHSNEIPMCLTNRELCSFIQYLEHAEMMKDYKPLGSKSIKVQTLTAIMTGEFLYDLQIKLSTRYARYKHKPKFKFELSRGQAAALLTYLRIHPCGDLVLYNELIKVDQLL